jgi:hypothetical protein
MPAHLRRGVVLVVGALMLLVAFGLWTQARQVNQWTQDEEYFVQLSRLLSENFPGGLWDLPVQPFDERGIQRVAILLLAGPLALVRGELGLDLARALMALAFVSAAIPAYLLARGVGLRAGWAIAAAALAIVVPWAVVTGSFLTEPVAYPAALWAIWGAWRCLVVPGLRSDLVAVALVVVAGLCRTNLLVLVVVAPAAAVLHALYGGGGLRAAARRLWTTNPLWAVLVVPGALLVVLNLAGVRPGPLASLSGNYITSLELLDFGPIPEKMAGQVSRIVTGLGVVPAVLGVAWIVRQVVRRTSAEEGALALVSLVGFVIVLFSTVYAAAEERYLMLVAPCLLLPGIVALARGRLAWWGVAAAGLVAAVLVARVRWPGEVDPTGFLSNPAEAFWIRVVLPRVEALPGSAPAAAGVLVALAMLVVAVLWRLRRPGVALVPVALLVAVALLQLVQTGYVVTKRASLAGAPGGQAAWAWVDRRAGEEPVGIWAPAGANNETFGKVWREIAFWNRRVETIVTTAPVALQIPRYGDAFEAEVDEDTGELDTTDDRPLPRLMLVPTTYAQAGLDGEVVARSSYLPVALVRVGDAPRASYLWEGLEEDGWLRAEDDEATLRVLPAAGRCLRIGLAPPPGADGVRFTLTAGDARRAGTLPARGRTVRLRVPGGEDRVKLRATGEAELPDGRSVAAAVTRTTAGPCAR